MSKSETRHEEKLAYARMVESTAFDPKTYEFSDKFVPASNPGDPDQVHTVAELHECLKQNQNVSVDGHAIVSDFKTGWGYRRINRDHVLESFKRNANRKLRLKEADVFATDAFIGSGAN